MKRQTKIAKSMTLQTIEEAMGENLRLGYVELFGVDDTGEPLYRMTPAGKAHVESLLAPREEGKQ